MNGNPDKWVPALVGGALLGVATALPVISCGCCLWMVGGGFLAVFVYRQRNPGAMMTSGDGALLGLMAAVVGSVIYSVISGMLTVLGGGGQAISQALEEVIRNQPDLPPEVVEMLRGFAESGGAGVGFLLIGFLTILVFAAIFATLGGILGVAILQKKPPQSPPPQWSQPQPPGGYQPPSPPSGGTGSSGESGS